METYRAAVDGLRHCLQLGDQVAGYGNVKSAVDYLIGALDDLEPELSRLRSFLAAHKR